MQRLFKNLRLAYLDELEEDPEVQEAINNFRVWTGSKHWTHINEELIQSFKDAEAIGTGEVYTYKMIDLGKVDKDSTYKGLVSISEYEHPYLTDEISGRQVSLPRDLPNGTRVMVDHINKLITYTKEKVNGHDTYI